MIQSMTGYSRTTRRVAHGTITVELRSTNHRYLEIGQRLPDGMGAFEPQVLELLRTHVNRGRVDLLVSFQASKAASKRVVVDESLATAYVEQLHALRKRFKLNGGATMDQLLSLPNVLSVVDAQPNHVALWPNVKDAVDAGVRELLAVRRAEGARLVKDIRKQMQIIRRAAKAVTARVPKSVAEQRKRLQQRVRSLVGGSAPIKAQIQEALALLKDTDIHEELVRLDSHLTHMDQVLAQSTGVGKKLDFISQELVREVNTIGAKANDARIARSVVEMKGAIEKIREQVQNLE